jgi:L-asparagine transporter-like permease
MSLDLFDFLASWIKIAVVLLVVVVILLLIVIGIGDEYKTFKEWKERPLLHETRKQKN